METLTLEQALDLFKLPRTLGEYEGEIITVGTGRFGPYVLHAGKYTSLPKGMDPMTMTIGDAVKLIDERRKADTQKHLKTFDEDPKLEVMNGRYGPYLVYDGKNYRLPKTMHDRVKQLTYEECMKLINK